MNTFPVSPMVAAAAAYEPTPSGPANVSAAAAALAALAEELSSAADFAAVMAAVVERVPALTGADDVAVFLPRDERFLRGVAEGWPRGRIGAVLDLARLPHSRLALTSERPVAWTRAECDGDELPWFERVGNAAAIAAPLVDGGGSGVLYLNFAVDRPAPTSTALELAAQVATRVAGAIARVRELADARDDRDRAVEAAEGAQASAERSDRVRERAELLTTFIAALNSSADLAGVLDAAVATAEALFQGQDGSVFLVEEGGRTIRGVAERRPHGRVGVQLQIERLHHIQRAIRAQRPEYLRRATAEGEEREWMARHGLAAALVLPLVRARQCLGVLFVNRFAEAAPPTGEDLAFGEAIAAHAALAISRAMAFESEREARARAEAAEAAARRAAQRLSLSQDLNAALAVAHDTAEVARAIRERGLGMLGARAANLCRVVGDRLELLEAFGYPEELMARWATRPLDAQTPRCECARTGLPIYVGSNADVRDRWPAGLELSEELGDHAWAALPLLVDGRSIGVLGVSYAEPRAFDLEDRAFLSGLSSKFAQALERARLFEAERAAREEAERVGKLQEQLLAVVGHDLRTPLSAITMATSLLFRRGGLDEKQAGTLTRIAASAERMTGIIRDLLDFSRARQGAGIPITRGPCDLGELAEKAVVELQAANPGRAIRLVRPEGDATIHADAGRIAQVLSNLLGNALQHGSPGTPVTVTVGVAEAEISLVVHNGGPPIPPEVLPEVFEPFKRGAQREDDVSGSIGLGLFIVKEIVAAHGGRVDVRSAPGEGTTFSVALPRG